MSKHDIEWAVRVLNEREFRGITNWDAEELVDGDIAVYGENEGFALQFDPDVAIFIAEGLERDAGRDMPATRKLMDFIRHGAFFPRSIEEAAVAEWEPQP